MVNSNLCLCYCINLACFPIHKTPVKHTFLSSLKSWIPTELTLVIFADDDDEDMDDEDLDELAEDLQKAKVGEDGAGPSDS